MATNQKDRTVINNLVKYNPTSQKIVAKLDEVPFTLSDNIVAGLNGANVPSASNVFATMTDITGGSDELAFYFAVAYGGML